MQSPSLPDSVSVYYDNWGPFRAAIPWACGWLAFWAVVYLNMRDHTTFFFVFGFFSFMAWGGMFVAPMLFDLPRDWAYTSWARNRKAVISFDRNAVTLLGEARIAWQSVTYVEIRRSYPGASRQPFSCLIIGLSENLQRERESIPKIEELTRDNFWMVSRRDARDESTLNAFLSLCISFPRGQDNRANHLTMDADQIGSWARRYSYAGSSEPSNGSACALNVQ